jgi:hypothetical protein
MAFTPEQEAYLAAIADAGLAAHAVETARIASEDAARTKAAARQAVSDAATAKAEADVAAALEAFDRTYP